jgi:hypothetical protein
MFASEDELIAGMTELPSPRGSTAPATGSLAPRPGTPIRLRFHLLICNECRRFMRQFKMMIDTTTGLNELDQPADKEIDALVTLLSLRPH